MKWCGENKLAVFGHTLVWQAQTNPWFFAGGDKEVITKRMKDHITTLVGRYKGKVVGWDVVNEAINDGGNAETGKTENLRNSQWVKIVGPEFLTRAFKYARDADPDARGRDRDRHPNCNTAERAYRHGRPDRNPRHPR